MDKLDRRNFLKQSLLGAASLSLFPAAGCRTASPPAPAPKARVVGANQDIRYAVVGFNGRGQSHIEGFAKVKGTRLVALCDVDQAVLGRETQKCSNRGEQVKGYTDVRKLLEDQSIDVVSFATPNHWHALGTIWAVQAGMDVYVEKPVSHEVWEGRQAVTAARKYNRIVQAGTQCRSSSGIAEAISWVQAGNLGKIVRARGLCYKRRPSIGKVTGPQPIPPEIDYDLWCGPAPKEPLMRKKLHYDWHWVWPSGNGDLGNQGIHQVDLARWALGQKELSPRVFSVGGRFGYIDDGTTPNTLIVFHDYPGAPLIFEVRGLPSSEGSKEMDTYRGADIGVVVDCEGGSMVIPDYNSARILDPQGKEIKKFKGSSSHFENFIDVVRSRNSAELRADILEGHISSALCHTGNISYRLGRTRPPEQIRYVLHADRDAGETYDRMRQHLSANKVDLHPTPATLGAVLKMDPHTERFIGNHKANKLLTREYRKPFVVPEEV
jgi:predicted dehydrogenase